MKRTILTALVVAASIGSQVNLMAAAPSTGSTKIGVLTFALTDTIQGPSSKGIHTTGGVSVTNTVPALLECLGSFKYQSSKTKVDNPAILRAISSALTGSNYKQVGGSGNGVFTSKATLVIWNYDNILSGPPYPPYLPQLDDLGPANTFNGPRVPVIDDLATPPTVSNIDIDAALVTTPSTWIWPNLRQIDWVDYDGLSSRNDTIPESLWPKAQVFVVDASNGNPLYSCVNVTPFFSFEEAYCYFCWDTVDRVTDGTFETGTTGEICIGSSCGTKGKGTTRYYMTIKFNNRNELNFWLNKYGPEMVAAEENIIAPWLPFSALVTYTFPVNILDGQEEITKLRPMAVEAWLSFSVGGVFVYPWTFKSIGGITGAYGTMTMAKATGFASNPWCGVLEGSVKVVEKTGDVCLEPAVWDIPSN